MHSVMAFAAHTAERGMIYDLIHRLFRGQPTFVIAIAAAAGLGLMAMFNRRRR